MAGGTVTFSYNELLYSRFSNKSDLEATYIDYTVISSYAWKCAVIYHPGAINPFINFSSYSIFTGSRMINLSLTTPNNNKIYMLTPNDSLQFGLYGECTLILLA